MAAIYFVLVCLAVLGHAAFWIGAVNRVHALGWPRFLIKSVSLVFYAALVLPVLGAVWWIAGGESRASLAAGQAAWLVTFYVWIMAIHGLVHLGRSCARLPWNGTPAQQACLLENCTIDMVERLGASPARGAYTRLLARLPGNQLFRLRVRHFEVALPRLPAELDGFTIGHWSDLHLCGRIDKGYFREVKRLTNAMRLDMLALTGDICENAATIDWIAETIGDVDTRLGKYFILGNHDLRTHDVARLRRTLVDLDYVDLGGRWQAVGNLPLVLAGNERPWFEGEPAIEEIERVAPPCALRVLLAHTPDRLAWARQCGFDLMLAGHTHGGQIRFGPLGPLVCPSLHGVRYAGGFYSESPTLMYVSQGTASLFPVRIGCSPEITRLVLRHIAD